MIWKILQLAIAIIIIAYSNAELGSDSTLSNERIIGGHEAIRGQFPYQISLREISESISGQPTERHICGGSIISNRWIISAAHCTKEPYWNITNLIVVVGVHHISIGGEVFGLERIINHPKYDEGTLSNDISLLRTDRDIIYGNDIKPLQLERRFVDGAVRAIVSGWGKTEVRY